MSNFNHSHDWLFTPDGEPRGYIQPHALEELWFHTGTKCNLSCSFCLEGSNPADKRLQGPKLDEVKTYIHEALTFGVKQFSFTGGEPFLLKDMVDILDYASQYRPCLVLTNGTDPLFKRFDALLNIPKDRHEISFRISLDSVDAHEHDIERGKGSFNKAVAGLRKLHQHGFKISVARHMAEGEDSEQVTQAFQQLFELNGLPKELTIVAFPDFLPPGAIADVPHITEHCMTHYQNEMNRRQYMCSNSKMIIKQNDNMQVYACTLVDDDNDYFLGTSLTESMDQKISMKHHRCYSCFAFGASCSER